jgi:Transglycosylase SLT domain
MRTLLLERRPVRSPATRPNQPGTPAGPRRGLAGRLAAVAVGAVLVLGGTGCFSAAGSGPPADVAQAIDGAFHDLGPGVVNCMTDIAWRESHWDPGARNSSGASGLFQILLPMHNDLFWALGVNPDDAWGVPRYNALAARELYNSSGISPWGRC